MEHHHLQVWVNHFGEYIQVDQGMVEILQLIWKEGYDTSNSCQNNFGNIWVEFVFIDEFKDLIQKAHDYNMMVNGNGWTRDTLEEFFVENITSTIGINDDGYITEDGEYVTGRNSYLSVSIKFRVELKETFIRLWKETFGK